MQNREGDASNFTNFMEMHRALLDCYAKGGMNPAVYKSMDPGVQRDFCFSQRVQLEDQLTKQKIRPQDFFKAAQAL